MKTGINKLGKIMQQVLGLPHPEVLAWLGIFVYCLQGVLYAFTRLPNLDEGFYLYKGLILTRGLYEPFQPYGPWINKMYLSFMTWGWVQQVLSPGLLGSRLFAVGLGGLSLFGIWKFARRWSNGWLASLAVWAVVLNPTLISIYSTARSQILIFFLFTWFLVFSVAAERRAWQIILSSVLLGVMILTRENMVFIFPIWIVYMFWQHGWKKGSLALGTTMLVLIIGHAIYWPEILSLWQKWLPFSLYPSTSSGQNIGKSVYDEAPSLAARLHSLSLGMRVHLIPILGSLLVCLFWPPRRAWKTSAHHRAALFLGFLFFTLLFSHAWASLGKDYCVFCFTEYTAFFASTGTLLLVVAYDSLKKTPSKWYLVIVILIVIITTTAIGFSLFEHIDDFLLHLPVPRMRYGRFLPGWADLRQILDNKFHIPYETARRYVPTVAGALVGILFLVIGLSIFRQIKKHARFNSPVFVAFGFLFLGGILSPVLNLPLDEPICSGNVIKYYEQTGSQLAEFAPPGTKIYMDGTRITPILLYLDDPVILLPQLNDTYSFRRGGNPDSVLRRNFWNEELAQSWREQSSVFLVEVDRLDEWGNYFNKDDFQELPTDQGLNCFHDEYILIFIRK